MNMDNFYGKDVPKVKSTTTSTFRYNDNALVDAKTINAYIEELEEIKEQRDEAIRLATLFQALYLRYGKAEDESYSTLLVKKGFESLANLKGLGYFGEEEA